MKRITLLAALLAALSFVPSSAQKKYSNPVYGSDFPDPTVQRAPDGTFYAYATGCQCKKSTDLVNWSDVPGVISRPTWNDSTYTDANGNKKTDYYSLWAADVNYVDGKYICYYASALWGNGSRTGIGVAVGDSPTKFTDKGKLFRSTEIGVKNSIDPCYVEEFDKKYIIWGSFNDICMAELTDDALAIKDFTPLNNPRADGSWTRHKNVTKLAGGAFEGAMIYKRGKFYYLFCSVGSCCEGEKSTYRTVVGRATKLKGPYVSKSGGQMISDNYTTIIKGDERWKGPGHNSEIITDDEGQTWLLYHSYDMNNNCKGRLMLLDKITWTKDGWPVVNDGNPSSDPMDAPVFYTGNGANLTYKVENADLMKSNWKGWDVTASEDCETKSGRGTAFMPFGQARYGGTFDISQTVTAKILDGLYEMRVNGFDSDHSVEYYVGKVGTPVICPSDNDESIPTSDATISNFFLNGRFSQSVYGLVVGGKLTFGMRTRQPLSAEERFCVGNVNIIYRDRASNSDSTALASVLNSYYAMAEDFANGGKPYYKGYDKTMAAYRSTAEGTEESQTRYQQLLKMNRTVDSIQTSIDVYAGLATEIGLLQEKLAVAEAGGYSTQGAKDALAEGQQVLIGCDLKDREVKLLINRLQSVRREMMYAYQKGDGTQDNPYVIERPEQLDHMHDVLIQGQMVYFVLAADVDMEGYDWKPLNTSDNQNLYWINLDGKGHVICNLTPNTAKYYPSFFGTMCGEIRNTGFVDAKVDVPTSSTVSCAAVIGGTLGHSTFKDADDNLYPVIIENCYVTGVVTSRGYVGAIGGTLGNSPVIIRNCYSAASVTGNATSSNYSGGLVGRVRTALTIENCYAAAPVSSPIAGGIVGGNQNSTTPGSFYTNVIAWNPVVQSTTANGSAEPFGAVTELDVLTGVYTFADMLLNGEPVPEGLSHLDLCDIAGGWGAPWYRDPTAGNGYPVLQWQYDRGDHRELCGFDPDNIPTGIDELVTSEPQVPGPVFNLSGQRVSKPTQKGIYIIDGRKVAIRR